MAILCHPEGKFAPMNPECGCDEAEMKSSGVRQRKFSAPAQIAHIAAGSMVRMVRTIRRHSIIQHGLGGSSAGSSNFASVGEEEPMALDEELPSLDESAVGSLRSLRHIVVTGTQVSQRGVRLLLRTSANVSVLT